MFELFIERSAEKSLQRLPRKVRLRLVEHILSLKKNPRPMGCRKIAGSENDYRIRIGDYRVIYEVLDTKNRVSIMAVGHRKDIYRR